MPNNPNIYNEEVSLMRRGWIDSYDSETDTLFIKLNNAPITSSNPAIPVKAHSHVMFYNNGLFMGTMPVSGTPIMAAQGSGGEYFVVGQIAENKPLLPELIAGQILLQSNNITKISLDSDYNVILGSDNDRLHINTQNHYISSNIDNEYNFTQASRHVKGVIKRDTVINVNFDQNSKLENDDYDSYYSII